MSCAQQDSAISDLVPALLAGERWLEKAEGDDQQNDELASLRRDLVRCMEDIRALLADIEDGHNRLSGIDTDELDFMIDFLVKEMKDLQSKIRTALALSRGRVRGR